MSKKLFLFIIALISVPNCFGQNIKQSKYAIKQSFPNIYIDYIKTDERIIFDDVKEGVAWFRLYNNSRKKIVLSANGGFEENDATLFYDILDENKKIIESTYCHACSVIRLSSGNSILFSLPAKDLKDSDSIRIDYKYDWKGSPFINEDKQPVFYAYFKTPPVLK